MTSDAYIRVSWRAWAYERSLYRLLDDMAAIGVQRFDPVSATDELKARIRGRIEWYRAGMPTEPMSDNHARFYLHRHRWRLQARANR